jgi:hypothetical protein
MLRRTFYPNLIRIGFWRSKYEPLLPDPKQQVDAAWDEAERTLVVEYLSTQPIETRFMGYSPCRFCGKDNGCAERSDGIYLWPDGLGHYLTEHGVRLSKEFVLHVRAQVASKKLAGRSVMFRSDATRRR